MDGDGRLELVEGSAENGDLVVACGDDHVGGDGPGRASEDGADADEGGDGDGVLVGLDGNEDGIVGGVGQNVAEEVGSESAGDVRSGRSGEDAFGSGNIEQTVGVHRGRTIQRGKRKIQRQNGAGKPRA